MDVLNSWMSEYNLKEYDDSKLSSKNYCHYTRFLSSSVEIISDYALSFNKENGVCLNRYPHMILTEVYVDMSEAMENYIEWRDRIYTEWREGLFDETLVAQLQLSRLYKPYLFIDQRTLMLLNTEYKNFNELKNIELPDSIKREKPKLRIVR